MKYKYVVIETPQNKYLEISYLGVVKNFYSYENITDIDLVIPPIRYCEYELLQHLDPILIFKHFTETTN